MSGLQGVTAAVSGEDPFMTLIPASQPSKHEGVIVASKPPQTSDHVATSRPLTSNATPRRASRVVVPLLRGRSLGLGLRGSGGRLTGLLALGSGSATLGGGLSLG
jgi:hypothetical protein